MKDHFFTVFLFTIFIAASLFCGDSFARPPMYSSPMVHRYNYGFTSMFGQGKMGNAKTYSQYRNMDFTTYQAFLGVRFSYFRLSVTGEYSYVAQKTDVDDVENTNLSGQSVAYGPKFEYYDGKESVGIFYRANSSYKLNKPDANGDEQFYSSKTGFNIQYTRRIKSHLGIVIDYTREDFNKSLPDTVKWDRLSVGFIITNFDRHPFPLSN